MKKTHTPNHIRNRDQDHVPDLVIIVENHDQFPQNAVIVLLVVSPAPIVTVMLIVTKVMAIKSIMIPIQVMKSQNKMAILQKNTKKKNKKKEKKSSHKHKSKDKSHKSIKKHKKHKKAKDKKKKKTMDNLHPSLDVLQEQRHIVKPDNYRQGQYGFIGEGDRLAKIPEFTSWLNEVHGISRETLPTREERKWWAQFCDDWNTGTMIDDKYYDIEKWDNDRKLLENSNNKNDMICGATDEELLRMQRQETRKVAQQKAYHARVAQMLDEVKNLKSHQDAKFNDLVAKHVPMQHTFETIKAKRRADKIAENVKKFGKFPNIEYE